MTSLAEAPEIGVVLGGGLRPDGAPTPSTSARAHRAALLARQRPWLALICSGDRPPDLAPAGPTEAALMRDAIVAHGVTADRIALEDESRDTLGNAILVSARYLRALQPRPLFVITSPFHLERATEIFRHVLGFAWEVQAVASDETTDDVERAIAETRYLQEMSVFFAGTRPGDLPTIARRLRERVPYYADTQRLEVA